MKRLISEFIGDGIPLLGMAVMSIGIAMYSVPAGVIALGLFLIIIGVIVALARANDGSN